MYSLCDLVSTSYGLSTLFLPDKVNAYLGSYSIINSFKLVIRANWLNQTKKGNVSSVPSLGRFSKLSSTWTGRQGVTVLNSLKLLSKSQELSDSVPFEL